VNNQLADKGFLVTSTDDLIRWARGGAPVISVDIFDGILLCVGEHPEAELRPIDQTRQEKIDVDRGKAPG